MKDVGQWVKWKPEPILFQEGPPLVPLTELSMKVEENGARLVQEDGATEEDDPAVD